MSILNKYKRWIPCLVPMKDEYWDFVLSQDGTPSIPFGAKLTHRCLSSYIEFGDKECQETNGVHSYSANTWDECVNNGALLEDIGYTGIDNGLIYYGGWERVSNKEFYDYFTKSVLTIEPNDCRLHMHQVTGNTGVYSYPMEYVEDEYYTLKGGFFQGFYKLHGFDYQVLPQYIENEWNVEITLRPRYLITDEKTLNATHPENEGIFFFMGARAEDKFMQFYNTDLSGYQERVQPDRKPCDSGYFLADEFTTWTNEDYDYNKCKNCPPDTGYPFISEYKINCCEDSGKTDCDCKKTEPDTIPDIQDETKKNFNKRKAQYLAYFLSTYGYREFSDCGCSNEKKVIQKIDGEDCTCCKNGFFGDDYIGQNTENHCLNYLDDDAAENYMEQDVVISGETLYTSDGVPIEESGYYEIQTDNKFLTFNRTKYGFTTANWDEDTVVVLTGSTNDLRNANLFLLMNRTCSGYTTQTIDQYFQKNRKEYDFLSDILGNAFALKRNPDGSISYRYLVLDCDKPERYSILEETSFPGLLEENKWATVNIKFGIMNGGLDRCGRPLGTRKMKIYIYVNGYLKFVSKELPEFNFRELKTQKEKQEGVPFNISVGGGTQGLCDSVWLDYWKAFEKILPMEKNFAGTFIGDIKTFRFYTCKLLYAEIRNNWLYNRAKWTSKSIYKKDKNSI